MKTVMQFLVLIITGTVVSDANAEWSANIAYASEYHYRGIFQKSSSASGGIDYSGSGFYAGAWTADVGDGLEIDGYFGFAGEREQFSYNIGFTGYYYTGDFDDTYQEINIGGSYSLLSAELAIGQYENFSGPTLDYTFYAIALEKNGFYGKFGGFSRDFEGNYVELGYGAAVSGIDLGLAIILASDELSGSPGNEEESIVLTLSKSFEL